MATILASDLKLALKDVADCTKFQNLKEGHNGKTKEYLTIVFSNGQSFWDTKKGNFGQTKWDGGSSENQELRRGPTVSRPASPKFG